MKKAGSVLPIHYQKMGIVAACPACLRFIRNISNYHLRDSTDVLNYEKPCGRLEKAHLADSPIAHFWNEPRDTDDILRIWEIGNVKVTMP